MRRRSERSAGAVMAALVSLGLLAVAGTAVWFETDHSTGRQTPPENPHTDDDAAVHERMRFYADRWEGDVEPSDVQLATRWTELAPSAILGVVVAMGLVIFGVLPGVHRIINRPVALVLVAVALVAAGALSALGWIWLPDMMAGHGIDSQFTARLDEPDGYTSSKMMWGWYAMAASTLPILAAGLFTFQAGQADAALLREMIQEGRRA